MYFNCRGDHAQGAQVRVRAIPNLGGPVRFRTCSRGARSNEVRHGGVLSFPAPLLFGVALAPGAQGLHDWPELASLRREHVFSAWGVLRVKAPLDDAGFFQSLEARRERIRADPRQRVLEILKFARS